MGKYETKDLRNIVLIGHGDAAKTSLAESMLFKAGATSRLGKVEEGSTVSDFDPEEKERRYSIDLAVLHCNWKGAELNILDAPGYPDFIGEAISGIAAADLAVVVINAAAGVMVNTRKVWDYAKGRGLPRCIVINKIDQENLDINALLDSIRETFGDSCVQASAPVGIGPGLKAIVDLVSPLPADLPADLKGQFGKLREKLIERAVEADDKLLEKYLEGGEVSKEETDRSLRVAIASNKLVPIMFAAPRKELGVGELLDFLGRFAPSPLDAAPIKGQHADTGAELVVAPTAPMLCVRAFKVTSDPFVGKISYVRVLAGALVPDSTVMNSRTKRNEKIGKVLRPMGKEFVPVDRLVTGDVGALAKIEEIAVSDTLCDAALPVKLPEISFPTSMVSLAVEPKSRGDEQRISQSLAKLADSDQTFKFTRDRQTSEMIISGISNLHLDVAINRLKRRFEVQVVTKSPKIPYKETIVGKGDATYRHKKQTGGAGQFAEVWLRVEPAERGKGFEFVNDVYGGAIPLQFIPSIEKGVKNVMETGVLAGYPVVDVKVSVYDGKDHPVDSKDIAFQIAGREAFKLAFAAARPVLLEPIANLEVTIPMKFMGSITSDLNSRRGRILGMDSLGSLQVIKAQIPLSEVTNYSTELRSITGGEASYSLELSHYDAVPAHLTQNIVEKSKAGKDKGSTSSKE
ncbi:MAG: elongation factor G [Planctomycetota bacterium]|nr:elongation factor G [Planctomycetota bacterium]